VLFFSVCKATDESGEVKLSMDVAENGDALQNAQKFTITEDGEGKAYLTYTDENGIQVREELDLMEDKANARPPARRTLKLTRSKGPRQTLDKPAQKAPPNGRRFRFAVSQVR
jgi:S1-C subfamily serine protease